MPRPRKQNQHLPRCVYRRHGAYYLVKGGKWERLGGDLASALAEYARRFDDQEGGFLAQFQSALNTIKPKVAPNTWAQYEVAGRKLKHMLRQFASPADIKAKDVVRVKLLLASTPNMANRCLSVLRQVFDVFLEQQIIDSNPAIGVKRLKEAKRKRLITPEEFSAIYAKGSARLQCMMDLWRLTGQRVMDVVKIHRSDIREEGIYFEQDKTGARLLVKWTPDLRAVIERAKLLNGNVRSMTLFSAGRGKTRGAAPSYRTVHDQWVAACIAANVADADLRDLRAMSATEARRQGKNATALLGHTSPTMTARYLRDKEVPEVEGPSFGQVLDVGQKGK